MGRHKKRRAIMFQSTPPSGERSDAVLLGSAQTGFGFNPRPPPERGATARSEPGRPLRWSFNPRPPPERGATTTSIALRRRRPVSIHAPLRREERQAPTYSPMR